MRILPPMVRMPHPSPGAQGPGPGPGAEAPGPGLGAPGPGLHRIWQVDPLFLGMTPTPNIRGEDCGGDGPSESHQPPTTYHPRAPGSPTTHGPRVPGPAPVGNGFFLLGSQATWLLYKNMLQPMQIYGSESRRQKPKMALLVFEDCLIILPGLRATWPLYRNTSQPI